MQKNPNPKKSKQKPKPEDPEQSKRFEETARELESDTSGKSFERALKTVVPEKIYPLEESQ